jgi:hypothetical protein
MGLGRTCALVPLLLVFACEAEPATEAASPDEAAAEADTTVAPPLAPPPLRVQPRLIRFQHPAHGAINCTRCHTSIPGHARHAQVGCGECHELPTAHGDLGRTTEAECNACHHGSAQTRACLDCHQSTPAGSRQVRVAVRIAGRAAASRELAFDHERHESLRCTECHADAPRVATPRPCTECHREHHRPGARCLTCHSPEREAHDRDAHRTCNGAGCHADATLISLRSGRQVCLVCHARQETHEPGEDCARCHLFRDTVAITPGVRP